MGLSAIERHQQLTARVRAQQAKTRAKQQAARSATRQTAKRANKTQATSTATTPTRHQVQASINPIDVIKNTWKNRPTKVVEQRALEAYNRGRKTPTPTPNQTNLTTPSPRYNAPETDMAGDSLFGVPDWVLRAAADEYLGTGASSTASDALVGPTAAGAATASYRTGRRRRRRRRLLTSSDKADIAFLHGQLGSGQLGRAAISALLSRRC